MDDMVLILIVVAVGLAAGGGFYFFRIRKGKAEPIHYFRCPSCHHKLRYYSRQVGHRGMCNNCKQQLTFPPVARVGR